MQRGQIRALSAVVGLATLSGCIQPPAPVPSPKARIVAPIHVEERPAPTQVAEVQRGERLRARYSRVERNLLRQGKMIESIPSQTKPASAASLAANFIAIAFFQEYAADGTRTETGQGSETALHRWDGPIRMRLSFGKSVSPERRARDTQQVTNYAKRLAGLTGLDISFTSGNDANFHVLVAAEPDRAALLEDQRAFLTSAARASLLNLDPRNFCAVATSGQSDTGRITRAVALIRDENPPLSRRSCFHEELAQALGLSNDSPTARPTIFNDDDEFALLTGHDEYLLKILYDPRLEPGMTRAQATPIVTEIARELVGRANLQ